MGAETTIIKAMELLVAEFDILVNENRMQIWLEQLKGFDDDVIEKAVLEYILTKNTKPYLSDIISICRYHQKPHPKAMRMGDKWVMPNQ